jgi:hypothetical protein
MPEKYKRNFQIFITIVIKHIMEFFHFLFEIFIFLVENIYNLSSNIDNKCDKAYHGFVTNLYLEFF